MTCGADDAYIYYKENLGVRRLPSEKDNHNRTRRLCICAIFMALNIGLSSFGIPVPGGHLYFNDVIIDTAAIMLDPFGAFIVGGVGAFLGDFFFYPAPMFISLLIRGLQALVISLLAHKVSAERPVLSSGVGVTVGAVISVIGYTLGRAYIYATPESAMFKLPYQILMAGGGAAIAMMLCWEFELAWHFRRRFGGETFDHFEKKYGQD